MKPAYETLKTHRDNLVKLISENATAQRFLAELLETLNVLNKFSEEDFAMAKVWSRNACDNALFEVEATGEEIKKKRKQLLEGTTKVVLEVDRILKKSEIEAPKKESEHPEFSDTMDEEVIKKCFIDHGPLKGVWIYDCPANLKEIRRAAEDALKNTVGGFLSEESIHNLYRSIAKHIDLLLIKAPELQILGRLSESYYLEIPNLFDGKTVMLIKAKVSEKDLSKAIDQLLEYKNLFKADWENCTIENIGIISSSWNQDALNLCKKNNVHAWEVTCKEVIELF